MIYLAPIQGFTDFVYRKAFAEIFPGIDAFFIPYIFLKNGEILKKQVKDILPENNSQSRVIPQVLVKDSFELLQLAGVLKNHGYNEINLNLGCPYPMVTNRGMGSGLLPHPEKIEKMLSCFFEKTDLKLSVKLRAGLNSPVEIEQIIPILNKYPLAEIIFHPRIAKQLYSGEILENSFRTIKKQTQHKLVFNGDIFSDSDFLKRQIDFPETSDWMLGRGVLMNPFLPAEISGSYFSDEEKRKKSMDFHQVIFEGYSEKMDNPGNVLNKMKQFWSYFSFGFPNQKKVFKKIKKAGTVKNYLGEVQKIFREV